MTAADLWYLVPEFYLGALGLALLVLDLFVPEGRKRIVGWVAIGGLALSLAPTAAAFSLAPRLVLFNTYAVDPFATFIKLLSAGAAILVILVSLDYFRRYTRFEGEAYTLMVFTTLGLYLMASSADIVMLIVSIELVSLTSYILAGYLKTNPKSNEAGLKYFLYGAAATGVMVYGFSILYGLSGTTQLYDLAARLRGANPALLAATVVLLLSGFGFKIAMVPFHQWAPDVYEGAPTPYAAYFSVATKGAGLAVLLRTYFVAVDPRAANWVLLLAALSAATMTVGNLLAIPQRNIKRMLAYSSIAHAGFMLIGVVAVQRAVERGADLGSGMQGLLIYLLGYTVTNLGAFFVATQAGLGLGSDDIADYAGLAQRSPGAAAAMAIFMLSLTGIPPTAGFFGKFYIFGAAIDNGYGWLAVTGIVNSVISLYYYAGVIAAMYLRPAPSTEPVPPSRAIEAGWLIAAVATVAIGVFPEPFVRLVQSAAALLPPP